jgi:hypothetical protein
LLSLSLSLSERYQSHTDALPSPLSPPPHTHTHTCSLPLPLPLSLSLSLYQVDSACYRLSMHFSLLSPLLPLTPSPSPSPSLLSLSFQRRTHICRLQGARADGGHCFAFRIGQGRSACFQQR